jgi:hypothetical protein
MPAHSMPNGSTIFMCEIIALTRVSRWEYSWQQPSIATVPPPTLEKRLEALAAARTLLAQEHEFARRRREEIAALRREHGELVQELQELSRQYDPRLRSHVIRDDDPEQQSVSKASPDDPKHPGWPAGTPDGRGGKFRPKDGDEGAPGAQLSGDVIRVCFLEPFQPLTGTCRYWCHSGFLLDKQRNLGLGCPAIVLEPG